MKYLERDGNNKIINCYGCPQYDDDGNLKNLECVADDHPDLLIIESIEQKYALIKQKHIQISDEYENIYRYLSQIQAGISTTLTSQEFNTKVQSQETLYSEIETLKSEISTLENSIGQT